MVQEEVRERLQETSERLEDLVVLSKYNSSPDADVDANMNTRKVSATFLVGPGKAKISLGLRAPVGGGGVRARQVETTLFLADIHEAQIHGGEQHRENKKRPRYQSPDFECSTGNANLAKPELLVSAEEVREFFRKSRIDVRRFCPTDRKRDLWDAQRTVLADLWDICVRMLNKRETGKADEEQDEYGMELGFWTGDLRYWFFG